MGAFREKAAREAGILALILPLEANDIRLSERVLEVFVSGKRN
jgi:hypothetical protein